MTLDTLKQPRNGVVLLGILFGLLLMQPRLSLADDLYVQVGSFSDAANVRIVRGQLEREGFPVAERLVPLASGETSIVILVGPYARVDQARYSLNKLRQKGWQGIMRRYATVTPTAGQMAASELSVPPSISVMPTPVPDTVSRPDDLAPPPVLAVPDLPTDKATPSTMVSPVIAEADVEVEPVSTLDHRWSGVFNLTATTFDQYGLYPKQKKNYTSLALTPELYLSWNDGDSSLLFVPFARVGDHDDERNHADIRELMWLHAAGDWEFRAGVGKVFWGVTESMHLVDVINQMDLVEALDGEDKLGQPMVQLTRISEIGTFSGFVLPYFRERTYPGVEGRLRGPLVVDHDMVEYESDDKEKHVDWAVRWSHYIGDIDIGLSHFSGTNREPTLRLGMNTSGEMVFIPRYEQIDQTGLDLQALMGDWIWKLETISRKQTTQRFYAAVAGFEYTYVGLFDSAMDLGMLVEYLYDERGIAATTPYADDWMAGLRWVFNDVNSTEVLLGVIVDAESDESTYSLELSRRLGAGWTIAVEARGSSGSTVNDPFYPVRKDNYLLLDLSYHF